MSNNTPLLSICIPTYNRSQYLEVCLHSILEQVDQFPWKLEIIVSDNASTDSTENLVKAFQSQFSFISYYKNFENLGYDRNLDHAIRMANGKFCWFLSDDEKILSGTLKILIDLLESHQDIAYLCFDVRGNSIRKIPTKHITYLRNGIELLEEYGIVGGLISQNIIARKYFPENTEKYFGNLWIHLSIIYEIILNQPLILLDQVLIKWQRNECTWAKWWKGIFTYTNLKNIILSWWVIGYPKRIITLLLREFIPSFPKILISAKVQGLPMNMKNFQFMLKEYYQFPFQLIEGVIIFFIPTCFIRFLIKILWK